MLNILLTLIGLLAHRDSIDLFRKYRIQQLRHCLEISFLFLQWHMVLKLELDKAMDRELLRG